MARRPVAEDNPVRLALLFLQRRIGIDALAWAAGLTGGALLRYDLHADRIDVAALAACVAFAIVLQLVVGLASGLYLGRWRLASFDEISSLAGTVLAVSGLLFAANLVLPDRLLPRSTPLGGGAMALVLMGSARYAIRSSHERRRRPNIRRARRLLVFGAGEAGVDIVSHLLRDAASPYLPVALLDDDPVKRNLRIMGVPVVGGRRQVVAATADHQADTLLIAIPSATAGLIRELTSLAGQAGLDVKVLPTVSELIGGDVAIGDIRTPTDDDLLGRQQVDTDVESIAHYLEGRRVLVTGAGGSIGSELCRQIARFGPAALIMVDRDESALHRVQLSIEGRALLDSPDLVLLDLRDRHGVERLFRHRRPEIIFHAAALKHLPLLERHPAEAVRGNVWVTAQLLAAADQAGVAKFVNISTDKAADPVSVLGFSKRIAERVTAHFAERSDGTYISVRFGNVLGSSGSVLPAFRAQIEAGGPVTVTHPDVTRYFMTVEEAVQLVIQAAVVYGQDRPPEVDREGSVAAGARPGEALVLDMGDAVRIDDVARRLVEESGRELEIVYTGLRPGEKMHEALFGATEQVVRRIHPLISHVRVPALHPDEVWRLDPTREPGPLTADLRALAVAGTGPQVADPATTGVDPSRVRPRAGRIVPAPAPPLRPATVPLAATAIATAVADESRPATPRRPDSQDGRHGAEAAWPDEVPSIAAFLNATAKRAFDLLGAAAGLVLVAPLLVVVTALVRIRLGSPVLFRQSRMGRLERSFKLVKFRTMTDGRDAAGRLLPDAERLTSLGRFLRATSLDELPELWNVLRGDMSLVGPRPLPAAYLRRYTPAERRRHELRPGITGWAQVHGRNAVAWDDRLVLDVWYVENRSLWLDVRILARTVAELWRRRGIHAEGAATMPELRPAAGRTGSRDSARPETTGPRIWLSPPDVRAPERDLVMAAIESGWVAPVGPDLDAFEVELAERCGVPHAVALASGTAALHLALLEVGVAEGDDVLVPTATFAATANAVTYCGARPCFVDVDPATWQISPALLAEELADRRRRGTLPAAVVTVDLYGGCADHDAILGLCAEYGVPVVEDAAEALGATFAGRPAGSFGAVGVLSFNGNKIVTASSGGALLCHDDAAADRARYLATQARRPAAHYEHTEVGFNYRLSNLLAAFGRGQLATLDERMARRRAIAARYRRELADLPGIGFQAVDPRCSPNGWLTCITLEPGAAHGTPGGLRTHLDRQGIESRPLWKPMHAQPVYIGHPARLDGTADHLFATGLCLPSGSGMADADLDRVVAAVRTALAPPTPARRPSRSGWGTDEGRPGLAAS